MMKLYSLILLFILMLTAAGAPKRILSTSAAANDILIRIGARDSLAAVDRYGKIVDGTERIPSIGRSAAISKEKILELGIDGAVVWYYQTDLQNTLRSLRIPFLALPPLRISSYPETVRMLGGFTERRTEAERLAAEFQTRMKAVRALPRDASKTVYFELYSPYATVGKESYIGDLLELAGAVNIAEDMIKPGPVARERILERRPEYILFVNGFATTREIAGRGGFRSLPAVRKHRIHGIDRKYLISGVDPEKALALLREILYGTQKNNR